MKESLYVWFDTEYSDLELETAALLQIAAIATDASLRRVLPREHDVSLAIRLPRGTAVSAWSSSTCRICSRHVVRLPPWR